MTDDSPEAVQGMLAKRATGEFPTGEQQLVFNPSSGKLEATARPSADAVIATSTTDDGYFTDALAGAA